MNLIETVRIDVPSGVIDAQGRTKTSWTEHVTDRAAFNFLRGGETVQAARLRGQQPMVATLRRAQVTLQITPEMRLVDLGTGTIYNIRAVVPTGDRRFVEITCQSGVES